MADILITNVDDASKAALADQAAQRGMSLDAYLRQLLELNARQVAEAEEPGPLGSWLVDISRPGADLDDALEQLRTAPIRQVDLG